MAKFKASELVSKIIPVLVILSAVISIWAGSISIIRAIKEKKALNDLKNETPGT